CNESRPTRRLRRRSSSFTAIYGAVDDVAYQIRWNSRPWRLVSAAQNAVRLANRILTRVKSPRAVENGDPWREAASGPSLRFGDRMLLQRRLGNRDKFRCAQQSDADRRRHRKAEGNNHARADDRRQPDFGVAQGHEILDRRAVRHVAGNRGEIDRADSRGSLITAVSLDSFHAPEFAVQIVANAAVEYCHLAIAGFRRDRIAAAADPIEHRGH